MFWEDIMTPFGPMCVVTSAFERFIPIFKLAYFWNAKTYKGEILIWRHTDGVLSEKPKNTHNLNSLFFNGCLGWKFKNWWNDWYVPLVIWCNFLPENAVRWRCLLIATHIHLWCHVILVINEILWFEYKLDYRDLTWFLERFTSSRWTMYCYFL